MEQLTERLGGLTDSRRQWRNLRHKLVDIVFIGLVSKHVEGCLSLKYRRSANCRVPFFYSGKIRGDGRSRGSPQGAGKARGQGERCSGTVQSGLKTATKSARHSAAAECLFQPGVFLFAQYTLQPFGIIDLNSWRIIRDDSLRFQFFQFPMQGRT